MPTRFYCPRCWKTVEPDVKQCPTCSFKIHEFWSSKSYIEKLIIALRHPEPNTTINAAVILGSLKDPKAVQSLIDLVKETDDVYIARAAIRALGEIGTREALSFLQSLCSHPNKLIRNEVEKILT